MSRTIAAEGRRQEAQAGLPVVALVGRPNVGKSALFNRMVGRRQALVEDIPGTTRDRLYGEVEWKDERFRLVDTGGLDPDAQEGYPELVRRQVEQAVEEASVLLFVVDARSGIIPPDQEVGDVLRRAAKPVFLVVNKVDNEERREAAVQFYELGLGEPMPVSAQHNLGLREVLDRVIGVLPPAPAGEQAAAPRLAIVGRPNVGKSMLLNAMLGEERVMVSDVPGTTRDAIDTTFEFQGRQVVAVDTAGLRRPGKTRGALEHHASLRARHALERADTALCVFDGTEGLTSQDMHIIGYALDAKTGILVVANKWDLMAGADLAEFERAIRARLHFAPWLSFRIVSAKERAGIDQMLREALRITEERTRRVETAPLNAVVQRAVAERPPPLVKNQRLKLLYVNQPQVAPPTFVFFVNDATLVHFSYRRYLENVIRRAYGYQGVALKLVFRSRRER